MTTITDTIERDLVLAQPVERVWAALTNPEELGSWFPDRVELDVRPGGEGTFTFDMEGGPHVAAVVVEALEPMTRFAFSWGDADVAADQRTLVDFTLEAVDGGTRLHLVESGFAKLSDGDDKREDNEGGWTFQLGKLPGYLAA